MFKLTDGQYVEIPVARQTQPDIALLASKISELEAALAEKDAKISELEAALAEKKK